MENALELLDTGGEFYLDSAGGKLYYAPRAGETLASADVAETGFAALSRIF
jgi:hypothetical protein